MRLPAVMPDGEVAVQDVLADEAAGYERCHECSAVASGGRGMWVYGRRFEVRWRWSAGWRGGRRTRARAGYQPAANPDFLVPSEAGAPRLHLDETDRTHLDLWAADEHEQLAEVERLLTLGASRVEWNYPEGADFVVLADPDGNLFCVINANA